MVVEVKTIMTRKTHRRNFQHFLITYFEYYKTLALLINDIIIKNRFPENFGFYEKISKHYHK